MECFHSAAAAGTYRSPMRLRNLAARSTVVLIIKNVGLLLITVLSSLGGTWTSLLPHRSNTKQINMKAINGETLKSVV